MAGKVLVIKGADFSSVAVEQVQIIDPSAPMYRLTVTSADADMGSVSGGGMYAEGANVTITATANKMYKFKKWSDNNTNATRTITMGDADLTLSAIFEPDLTITDAKLHFNKASTTARTALYYEFIDIEDFQIGFEVAANSPYKVALHLMGRSASSLVTYYSGDRSSCKSVAYTAKKDSNWISPGNNVSWDDSNTDVDSYETTNGYAIEIIITSVETSSDPLVTAPSAADINQYVTITSANMKLNY